MSKSHLLKYLLISPNLPVGGFCYSEGMESYLHNKNLKDSNSVKELIISELKIGQIRLDARLLLDFFDIFNELNDGKNLKSNLQKLLSLDQWILSSKDSVEMREQQTQMAKFPIGSTKAQLIQRDLLEIISKVSKEIMDKEIDDIYFGNVGLAMAQQNHNDLYTKLFRN